MFNRKLLKNILDKNAKTIRAHQFLSDYAANLLQEKLELTKLSFEKVLNLGAKSDLFYDLLKERNPKVKIIETSLSHNFLASSNNQDLVVCDEELLPFKEESFDLVVAVLNLHNVNDLVGSLVQIRNILKDKGLFIGCMIGGESLKELRQACLEADSELGGASPKVAPFIEVKTAGSLLQRAGFHMPITDSDQLVIEYETMDKFFRDLKNMGEGNILESKTKNLMSKKRLNLIKEIYLKKYKNSANIPANFELINLTAFKN